MKSIEDTLLSRLAKIELHKEELKFSAGHFMIHSDTVRENMHGHDYQIGVAFHTLIKHNGMAFDVRIYKDRLKKLCAELDYKFLLPSQSELLRLEDGGKHWIAHTCGEAIPFLKRDAMILDICNVTLEELSYWIANRLAKNPTEIEAHAIQGIEVTVYNGRGESGTYFLPVPSFVIEPELA